MCSMVDYEMFLPHSPPVFSHSPPASFLGDFQSLNLNQSFHRIPKGLTCRQNSFPAYKPPTYASVASPKRPCLVIRPSEDAHDEDPTSPTKLKKRVVFADDRGRPLTHVRVMSEPSNVPPLWSMKFLAEVTRGVSAEPEAQVEPWEVTFSQPASDYIAFRNQLETNMVSLENVIVKDADDQIVGTVKVKNISFRKEVFVRHTFNGWKTYEDSYCSFIPNNIAPGTTYVLYDTFSFKINLQPKARKVEFCVCFKCDDREYWDSNGGKNYVITKKALAPLYKPAGGDAKDCKSHHVEKFVDASHAKLDSWTQFASWNHLENSTPYW
ncbi:protein phosphatase 1 regulatory subunit 3B [Cylas formicarius]|uniref:protein phosphatase 1 regulatory subunit 3B n=1 Tax=Cylas formicarius TaxID=197179 RepID=UPI002958C712|nr:protein phosphatase 1 regulatory subunit 3B [Cylas formicarius]XP_060523691.1 protein phosphatase 1 regulatory subunit 3B [Cylas formicarius]XP_060523692.1 protein phosphatase 1 regulatory subunit 3B [Cylas formicarius]